MDRDANTPESCPKPDLRVRGGEAEEVEYRLPASESPQSYFCQRKEPVLQKPDLHRLSNFQNSIGGE